MRMVPAALLLALGSACSAGTAEPESVPAPSSSAPLEADPRPGTSPACAEVRDGIREFNAGNYTSTIAHFKAALPIAKTEAAADPSTAAQDLFEAVQYYADLLPADYPEAARSSPEFAKYKSITLGQCVPVPLEELPGGETPSPETQT
ncbi:MAG: hypothetical protein ABIN79_05920 [Marmoricola sp.]